MFDLLEDIATLWLGLGLFTLLSGWMWWRKRQQITPVLPSKNVNTEKTIVTAATKRSAPWHVFDTTLPPKKDAIDSTQKNHEKLPIRVEDTVKVWRPPSRESLLHRQQQRKVKPSLLSERRDHFDLPTAIPTSLRLVPSLSEVDPFVPTRRSVSADSKTGKRRGLESLVNVMPKNDAEHTDDPKNS